MLVPSSYNTSDQFLFYNSTTNTIADDARPFSENIYESSPLGVMSKEYGPGSAWGPSPTGGNHPVEYSRILNTNGSGPNQEKIIAWRVGDDNVPAKCLPVSGIIEDGGYYSSNQLVVKVIKDEQGGVMREYTNRLGQIVLKKKYVDGDPASFNIIGIWAEIYYIYDDSGRLVVVLPPEAVKALLN